MKLSPHLPITSFFKLEQRPARGLFHRLFWPLASAIFLWGLLLAHSFSDWVYYIYGLTFIAISFTAYWVMRMARPLDKLISKLRSTINQNSDYEFAYQDSDFLSDESELWGELEGLLAQSMRVTRQKTRLVAKEQGHTMALLNSITEGVLAVDLKGKFLFHNSRFSQAFVLSAMPAYKIDHISQVFRAPELLTAFEKVLLRGRSIKVTLSMFNYKVQRVRYYKVVVSALRKAHDNSIYGAVATFHDLTAMKRLEQMRIDFVANVSHELRTPLTAIKGYLSLLRPVGGSSFDNPQNAADWKVVDRNLERLLLMVQDLTDLSAIESGTALQIQPFDCEQVTELAIDQIKSRYQNRELQFVSQYQISEASGDAVRIEQVLLNLIDNAVKYNRDNNPIGIIWEKRGNKTCLIIKDNGQGIPEGDLSRVFERFFRVNRDRAQIIPGTGLGLAIVKHIIQRHNGRVWVESKIGQGTTFTCEWACN